MRRLWIELRRAPDHDDGATLAYDWAWGYTGEPRTYKPDTVDGLIVREASGSIRYAGDPYFSGSAIPAMCLLANHIRDTGEVPDRLSYTAPEIQPSPPIPDPRDGRRLRQRQRGGLDLGTLGERAQRHRQA